MSELRTKNESTNKLANEQYKNHARREEVIKELFDMVYNWGRWNIVADDSAPAYRETIKELLKI